MKFTLTITFILSAVGLYYLFRNAKCSEIKTPNESDNNKGEDDDIYADESNAEKRQKAAEALRIKREDYYNALHRKDRERHLAENLFSKDLGALMRLLVTLNSAGIGAILYSKSDTLATIASCQLLFLFISLLCIFFAYGFSLKGLRQWATELTNIEKKYEDMDYPSNRPQYILIIVSIFFMLATIVLPLWNSTCQ